MGRGHVGNADVTTEPNTGITSGDATAPAPASTYYWRTEYHEERWENADGSFTTEHHPYCAIREKPDPNSEIGSHEIAETISEGWAQRIVDALNAAVPAPLTAGDDDRPSPRRQAVGTDSPAVSGDRKEDT